MRQHNIWCVYVRPVWRGILECSQAYLSLALCLLWPRISKNKLISTYLNLTQLLFMQKNRN